MKTLTELSARLTELAGRQLSIAYYIGIQQGLKQTGGRIVHKWDATDQANVQLLTDQFRKQIEARINGIRQLSEPEKIESALQQLARQATTWAWTASPALAMGKMRVAQLIEAARQARAAMTAGESVEFVSEVNDIIEELSDGGDVIPQEGSGVFNGEPVGVIWFTAEDMRVCHKCDYLNGRWFPAQQAYQLASSIHPHCRCPQHFRVGVPSDALVGPIGDYNANSTADDILSHIGEEANERRSREREQRRRDRMRREREGRAKPKPSDRR